MYSDENQSCFPIIYRGTGVPAVCAKIIARLALQVGLLSYNGCSLAGIFTSVAQNTSC